MNDCLNDFDTCCVVQDVVDYIGVIRAKFFPVRRSQPNVLRFVVRLQRRMIVDSTRTQWFGCCFKTACRNKVEDQMLQKDRVEKPNVISN